ncbi:hypothetical protein [Luteimonas sp. e5]
MLLIACSAVAEARSARASIARVSTPLASMQGVRVQLDWPADASEGVLRLQAREVVAADLGYRFRDVDWHCPLRRMRRNGWHCDGTLRTRGAAPTRLALRIDDAGLDAALSQGAARLAVQRREAAPELTRIDLTRVPLHWAQALAVQAWSAARLGEGRLDGRLRLGTPSAGGLRVQGPLQISAGALQSADGGIVAEGLDARLLLDYRSRDEVANLDLQGEIAGEALFGEAYLGLSGTPVTFALQGEKAPGQGWRLPVLQWRDADRLEASGSAALDREGGLQALEMSLSGRADDALRERYLSGWLARMGMADVALSGHWRGRLRIAHGRLQRLDAVLDEVGIDDPRGRFAVHGLDGTLAFAQEGVVDSALGWREARMYGLAFGAARLPLQSRGGELVLRRDVQVPLFGGEVELHGLRLLPPGAGHGLQLEFGLELDAVDLGAMASTFGLPEFRGELNGQVPRVQFADDRLEFDGGLSLGIFDGAVQITNLSMERPFGTAPTLSADLDFNDLDLLRLTEVFDFGSISGRLDGHVHALRLVDWTPVQFDALLQTDPRQRVRQRISQRAVQNMSSVGDQSFVSSLQGRLIGLFDDFGYRRIGIRCRLRNEVCLMGGLEPAHTARSDSSGFTIVEGSGLPRLTVVGHNREVDWPTLVQRLQALGKGEVKPVFD